MEASLQLAAASDFFTSAGAISGLSSLLVRIEPLGIGDPLQRESMASWAWRVGQANGFLCAGDFLRNAGIQVCDLSRLDIGPKRDIVTAALASLTLFPQEVVATMTLTANLQHLGVEESPNGHPWVLCRTNFPAVSRGAFHVVCPSCLREDKVPYWRQYWRLATAVRCPVHHHSFIDQCEACNTPIVLTQRRTAALDICESCGTSYLDHEKRAYSISRAKWIEVAPLSICQEQLPLPMIDPLLWWTGLRAVLHLLCVPRRASRFALADLPSTHLPVLRLIAQTPRAEFPEHAVAVRHGLMRLCAWLISDWPENFIPTMKASGVSACDFNVMEFRLPYWLQAMVNERLEGKRYQVSQSEVSAASAALSRSQRPISKVALKRQLGVTEGKALDFLLPPGLKKLPDETMYKIMVMLDGDIEATPSARDAQASALRDACCIAAAVWLGISFTKVCELSDRNGLLLNRTWQAYASPDTGEESPISHQVALAKIFWKWGDRYTMGVRLRFGRYEQDRTRYFLTRYGHHYGGFGLAGRFADLLRRAGVDNWSAGARLLVKNGVAEQRPLIE